MANEYLHSDLTKVIIGAALTVHKTLGPGFPEKIYQKALQEEFRKQNIPFVREKQIKVFYENTDVGYTVVDFFIYDKIIVELKVAKVILDVHTKQVIGYLKTTDLKLGLILNFGKSKLEIKRVIV
jgi:GxxExxY protein